MTAFLIKHRSSTSWKEETVEAESREQAVDQVVKAAPEGSEIEIANVAETDAGPKPGVTHAGAKEHHEKEERHGKK